ncbi:hypothetical protein [Metabacillus iocasae]|uniref:Uncharacterized protein n=1 Tax=Priestia iocasae TaxID=2291674 RepID=A0ABS2QSG7_9BACI|nr:hypothetical protein [Metabacillus iocasae]MBM7702374.1 hypothetical protein [Metabacillus iocasae]
MNKFGILSFLTFSASVLFFFAFRGPNANLSLGILVFGALSLLGILFAILSKRWVTGIIGGLLNGLILVFTYLLLLAKGIGG